MHAKSVRVSVLDEVGNRDAPAGSRSWALWIVAQAKLGRDRLDFDAQLLRGLLVEIQQHETWKALDLLSFDMLCSTRLKLSPDEVEALLKAERGQTVGAVITKTQAIRERRATHPGETQQATADAVGCSQQMVAKIDRAITTESCNMQQKVVIPAWITEPHQQADFRKLPAEERARLEALPENERRGSVRAAAIQAGIIRVPTPLERAIRAVEKLDQAGRMELLAWLKSYTPPVGVARRHTSR